MNYFKKENGLLFLGGAITGIFALQFLKSKTFHDLAVNTVAQGISLKDSATEEYINIKEEAEDICAEAKTVAKQKQSKNTETSDALEIED